MAGIDEIKRLKGLCEEYGLEGREMLAGHTDEELAGIFNGIGPEAFPQWLRAALDALHPSLAPVGSASKKPVSIFWIGKRLRKMPPMRSLIQKKIKKSLPRNRRARWKNKWLRTFHGSLPVK